MMKRREGDDHRRGDERGEGRLQRGGGRACSTSAAIKQNSLPIFTMVIP